MPTSIEKEMQRLQEKYGITFAHASTLLISYPKSGRTWLRMMLAKLMMSTYKEAKNDRHEIFPSLHDSYKEVKARFKEDYKDLNIIFLHRHPADTVISYFKEMTTNTLSGVYYAGTMSECLRNERHGLNRVIEYNNMWVRKHKNFNRFLMLSYYMLHKNPFACLAAITQVVELPTIKEAIEEAIEYSTFDNMKKIEKGEGDNLLEHYKGNFGVEPGRVRVGKYNNYHNILSEEDIKYVEECMKNSKIVYSYDEEK